METGFEGSSAEKKAYDVMSKMEALGEKTGLVVNRKVTKLGIVVGAVATVAVFGGVALVRAFFKGATRR
jgi:hypothetical protein